MSILKSLFNSNKSEKDSQNHFPWKSLTALSQLDEIEELSKTNTIFIFKHSTRCGISRMVLSRFEEMHQDAGNQVLYYYLDLLNFREISNEIAARYQVIHQSPQLLVIKNGICMAHGSHYDVLELEIKS